MYNDHLRHLKRLKTTPVPDEAVERGRIRLQAFMAVHPMIAPRPAWSWLKRPSVWKPALGLGMIAAVVSGAGGAVYAADSALPGDRFYPVKILGEEVRASLTLSTEARIRIRAEQAERRLSEAEELMKEKPAGPQKAREDNLRQAMQGYQDHVNALNALAVKIENESGSDDAKSAQAVVVASEVEHVLEHHETLVDSASASGDAEVQAALTVPMARTLELESQVAKALSVDAALEAKMRENVVRLRRRLEKFQERRASHDKGQGPSDSGEKRIGTEDDHSHEHTEAEAPKISPPPGETPAPDFRVNVAAGSDLKTKTDVKADLGAQLE